ncbi:sigma-54-dependent Fis family transcriptional regulator [Acetobacterium tundrae]|uniref:PAS domain-containing protein n=1 Tax=Acetobacterium tundrae TaxID=132932 RepID=A0ABR6WN06_9FIRM|nr:sigma 54-interacting transcriptional regulator [Acetobacterium tundrae]MBC3797834.1 PAS domain-containing protein [Acetobacterium tundrae]
MNTKIYQALIKSSLERCSKFGITEDQIYSKKIIDNAELQVVFAKNRNLILTASPYIEHLMSIVRGKNFFVLLTDKEGCILNAIGDEKILSEAFNLKMIAGAYMNEECIGTNAMSLVIKSEEPVQLSGKDHFIKAYHRWTCSGAPIKDVNGNLIGALNLTGYSDSVHPHTLGMVIAASNAIEEMLKVKEYNRLQNMTNKHIKTIFNSMPVAILTSDLEGRIKIYNQKAVDLCGNKYKQLTATNVSEIIEEWSSVKEAINLEKNVSRIINIKALRNHFPCLMTASPIYNPQDDSIEIVFVLKEDQTKINKRHYQPYYTFDKIMGKDKNFVSTIEYAKKISNNRSTILILGESGCGKEVFAQAIHNYSKRMDEPFVALNCGAIPNQLIESELFGYEEGAYTGAKKGGNIGKFEQANNGTIMLDEIGEMPLDMQTRLLRVLQENIITKIGSQNPIAIDVRIIAATNKDLKKEVELGRFRKDLFYRLNVLPLYLPPLKERKSDIYLLFQYFMKSISEKYGKEEIEISEESLMILENYNWPGNVRELENIAELIVNSESFPIKYFIENSNQENQALSNRLAEYEPTAILSEDLENIDPSRLDMSYVEKEHITKVLELFHGNISQTSNVLGIQRNTLYSKIKKYQIQV